MQISAVMMSSVMPTSCCRKPVTARTRSSTRQTRKSWREYDRVRLEVTRFKSDVLNLYRSHVESLSRLPEFQKEEAPAEEPEESAAEDEVEETTAELNEKLDNAADAKAPETAEADDAAEDGDAEKSEDFWEKDESQLKLDPPPADAAPTAPDYAAFQGVKFSE